MSQEFCGFHLKEINKMEKQLTKAKKVFRYIEKRKKKSEGCEKFHAFWVAMEKLVGQQISCWVFYIEEEEKNIYFVRDLCKKR